MPAPLEKQVFYTVFINGKSFNVTGRKRTAAGYITLCIKEHPNCDVLGYVFEHRIIMEMKIGRFIKDNEVVHHKNEVKHDNRLSNLELMTHGEHTRFHSRGRKYSDETKNIMSEIAKNRFKDKKNHPSYKEIDNQLIKMIKEGKGPTEISQKLNVTRKTVYNKIDYLGLKEM